MLSSLLRMKWELGGLVSSCKLPRGGGGSGSSIVTVLFQERDRGAL